jgi:hypothetical protein
MRGSWRVSIAAMLALTGCSTIQTDSGAAYLAHSPPLLAPSANQPVGPAAPATNRLDIDAEVAEAAAIEPQARFPMKMGIARIEHGHLTAIPADEGDLWLDLGHKLGSRYGSFVPIDPLIVEFATQAVSAPQANLSALQSVVRSIRIGAARQHVDAVLIYEPASHSQRGDTPLQLLNWTVVGYYLMPSTEIDAEGHVQALFIDVRNGYPYATLQGNGKSSGITASNMAQNSMQARGATAQLDAVKDLIGQVEPTLRQLDDALAARR